jgi:hypothetical protein
VLLILLVSLAGCEFQQNPKAPPVENPAAQDISLVTPDENIALQDLPFLDATQWYVSTTGDDANHCHSPAKACRNIQTAIDRATDDDTIHIADGNYYEQLLLTKPLEIEGTSRENTIIDAHLKNRPLTLDGMGRPNGFNLDLSDVTLTGGATSKGGGFLLERGFFIVLTNVEILNNVGHSAGGGIYSNNTAVLNLNNVLIHDNQTGTGGDTASRGGGVFFGTGEGNTGSFPAFFVLNVNDSQIYGNSAYLGGGVFNSATMNIMRSLVESNNAESNGGGVYNEYDGTVGQSDVINNTAVIRGGGIFNGSDFPGTIPGMGVFESEISGNSAKSGGGIFTEQGLSLISSTISNNTASVTGGGVTNSTNFDIDINGAEYSGKLYAINSTISGNSAPVGGGVWNGEQLNGSYFPGLFEAKHITIANNTGGGIYYHYGSLSLTSVLLANNGQNCDFGDAFTVLNSMSSDGTCEGFIEADPVIAALADNGGLTQSHALLPGSPARDAALDFPSLFTDQRQFVRPLDSDGDGVVKWDIGAFEAEYITFPIITLIPTDTPMPKIDLNFIPDSMVACRQGPAILYAATGLVTPGVNYPLMGISADSRWYQVEFYPAVKCWVRTDSGKPSGDPALLEVIPFTIITITPTLTLTPTIVPSAFDCTSVTAESWCVEKYGAICEWKPLPPTGAPGCVNK